MVFPPQKTYIETVRQIRLIAKKLAKELNISGPFNIQFIAKDNKVKVIELNLRASRSFPFISKVFGTNFIELATRAILGEHLEKLEKSAFDMDFVGIKAPQFSFSRLKGADPLLGVEMSSTGEVACLGTELEDAFLKAMISTGFVLPEKNILLSISGDQNRSDLLQEIKQLSAMKYNLFATHHTHTFLKQNKIKSQMLHKI
jgi:carbamoyl-phosphate synthase large subunit